MKYQHREIQAGGYSALWPLLESQWKDPKKWWQEFCLAKGRKDYDWSHRAARYFPTREDG